MDGQELSHEISQTCDGLHLEHRGARLPAPLQTLDVGDRDRARMAKHNHAPFNFKVTFGHS
jgi:hypothetical protein